MTGMCSLCSSQQERERGRTCRRHGSDGREKATRSHAFRTRKLCVRNEPRLASLARRSRRRI
eukprot:scaffold15735_cov152-Amphora_coffeaeformis.AAC.10